MDSTGKTVTASGGQYFIDTTDPANPIYGVVTLPKFILNGNTYTVNLSTTLPDGVTSRYTLVVRRQELPLRPGQRACHRRPHHLHLQPHDRTASTLSPMPTSTHPPATKRPPRSRSHPSPSRRAERSTVIDVFNNPEQLSTITTRRHRPRPTPTTPFTASSPSPQDATTTTVPLQTGLVVASNSGFGYVISFSNRCTPSNGSPMFPYSASTLGSPATYTLMTAPQMFTLGGNFYTFDQDLGGNYLSVTGNGQTYPVNPYQFSINGAVYIINTNVQPNTVVGGGNIYTMTAGNTQFVIDGVQYTITLKGASLNGATISGQFNITQANVVVIENYVYELDTLNGQIVGNGTTYPLTTSGFTYTITTADQQLHRHHRAQRHHGHHRQHRLPDQQHHCRRRRRYLSDPCLSHLRRRHTPSTSASTAPSQSPPPLTVSAATTPPTFTDGATTYTVNALAAFDGTTYYPITGTAALGSSPRPR